MVIQRDCCFGPLSKSWLSSIVSAVRRDKPVLRVQKNERCNFEDQSGTPPRDHNTKSVSHEPPAGTNKEEPSYRFSLLAKETLKAAVDHFAQKWYRRLSFMGKLVRQIARSFWETLGVHIHFNIPRLLRVLHLDKLNSYAVQLIDRRSKTFEPTYLYTKKRLRHNIRTVNISISAQHSCFGNRWQQLLINRFVGYDTILMNSLLNSPGPGYLYNYQTRRVLQPKLCPGTTCRSQQDLEVSFTLRETQTRMLRFTVQLQHHARHRLPTFQLIFVHVIDSLVFVPIMIGILFFPGFSFTMTSFLAFMVPYTSMAMRVIYSYKSFTFYFFSYPHGFSYLALSTTEAFMQHLIMYFWNRFEVPALQRFMQSRHSWAPNLRPADAGANPGAMNSFSSLLLWILGGATSEGLNSILSMFRDVRDQGQVYAESPWHNDGDTPNVQ
ncbi:hypothetical protein MLD38_023171 [Melastoma candidum]|uniref:Uncharacterized protein n=1 Tax=Melastoma candidum TaxID=119954 RepID=A0ACB9QUU4_9MYRT|nr:hypothetical protein MLD38_023171 [Melastoma candidum]